MKHFFFLLIGALLTLPYADAQTSPGIAPQAQLAAPQVPQSAAPQVPATLVAQQSTIKFEDATANAGIDFTDNFGSAKLGSLLEGTGAGCVWFDYNNSGLLSLYVVSGRPLDDSMHPFPLKVKPEPSAA